MSDEIEPVEKPSHLWKKGQSGNPAGRKPGSRGKLASEFVDALQADFEQHGSAVIAKVRTESPAIYLKVVANLMPARLEAQLEAKIEVEHGFSDTNSIADILQLVANEAGMEAAQTLAGMFGLQHELPGSMKLIEAEVVCPHTGTTYLGDNGRVFPHRNCQCTQCREWRGDD
jgi:hypothetical protein